MELNNINDKNLKKYLNKEITIDELIKTIKGREPYDIVNGEVIALSKEEYKKKISFGMPLEKNKEVIVTPVKNHSFITVKNDKDPTFVISNNPAPCPDKHPKIAQFNSQKEDMKKCGDETISSLACAVEQMLELHSSEWTNCQKAAKVSPILLMWDQFKNKNKNFIIKTKRDAAYIVGKGPSLDFLTEKDFPDPEYPILCINESIKKIDTLNLPNPVYEIQQDRNLGDRCKPLKDTTTWVVSKQAYTATTAKNHQNHFVFDPWLFGQSSAKTLTAIIALQFLKERGITKAYMLAFDACTCGDKGYAEIIGESPSLRRKGDDGSRFLSHCGGIKNANRNIGIKLDFIPPARKWKIVTVLKSGGKYDGRHVNYIKKQCEEKIKNPFDFICLSDIKIDGINTIPLNNKYPGWWSKLELFSKSITHGPVLYLDLDVVIGKDIILPDHHDIKDGILYMKHDWGRQEEFNSSVIFFKGSTLLNIFDMFEKNPDKYVPNPHGDQSFLSDNANCKFIEKLNIKVASYKYNHITSETLIKSYDFIAFHGNPKPWDLDFNWIPKLETK